MEFYVYRIDSKEWPIYVTYSVPWLDANSYFQRDQLVDWLQEQNIDFEREQQYKIFIFRFKREEDSALFIMRWS